MISLVANGPVCVLPRSDSALIEVEAKSEKPTSFHDVLSIALAKTNRTATVFSWSLPFECSLWPSEKRSDGQCLHVTHVSHVSHVTRVTVRDDLRTRNGVERWIRLRIWVS